MLHQILLNIQYMISLCLFLLLNKKILTVRSYICFGTKFKLSVVLTVIGSDIGFRFTLRHCHKRVVEE